MEWKDGFSARYYYTVIDTETWRDLQRHELVGGSISKNTTNLMESASLDMADVPGNGEAWIRVWLDARQEGGGAHEALFTGLLFTPEVKWDGVKHSYSAECYSILKPASDILLEKGWYAPAGSGAELAASLLAIGPAPAVYAENTPVLLEPIVAENNETRLSMAWKIVNAIGWRIRITGSGVVSIEPKATDSKVMVDSLENDIVELEVADEKDWFSCPNVYRVTYKDQIAIAIDDAVNSPYSVVNRGREIWKEDSNAKLNNGETVMEYARRRLKEEQSPARTVSYNRRFVPGVLPGDAIQLHYPAQNIDGIFRINSQQIDLGFAARTSEEVMEL